MFKKKPQIKALAPLRSSDRRRLAEQIMKDYNLQQQHNPGEEQTPEQKAEAIAQHSALRNALLPENTQSARFTTTQGPDLKQASGTLYVGSHDGEEGRVLWFQIEGKICPSVYTLWRHADIVPLLHTPEIVVGKLKGGADLMTPGLAGGPPFPEKAQKGAVVAVASTEKPSVPVAVGVCEIDVAGLREVRGAKGHAVRNLHWAGDEVWGFGAGGRAGQVAPEVLEGWEKVLQERGLAQKVEALDIEDGEEDGGVSLNGDDTNASESNEASHNPYVDGEPAENTNGTPTQELTQPEIDTAFHNAFLYGIHKQKASNANTPNYGLLFPLSQSFIMSHLIQPYLPAFTPEQEKQLQIKKTSWKNIKKFVKALDKQQIVKCKEKDGHETVILDIDFEDQAIQNFRPYRLPKKEAPSGPSNASPTDQTDDKDDSIGQKLDIQTLYKPTAKLAPLFASDSKAAQNLLLAPTEVRETINAYIDSHNLISANNKRLVTLDPLLANSVFDGSGKLDTEVLAKGTVPRDALLSRIMEAMSPLYTIQRTHPPNANTPVPKPRAGQPPKVRITLETRTGNKTATKISGLEPFFISPRLLADELRKTCAGSTSVEPLAGAAKKNERVVEEIMVQGPQKDAVVRALEKRGLGTKWVEVLDKTKKGGKGR